MPGEEIGTGQSARRSRRQRKNQPHPLSSIPTQVPALNYSSKTAGNDFYNWVNHTWLSHVNMPPYENDYGVSEEIEQCIFKTSVKILKSSKTPEHKFLKTLETSFTSGKESMPFLHELLNSVNCIHSKEELVEHFALLSSFRLVSLFNFEYTVDTENIVCLCINPNIPGLNPEYYKNPEILEKYKELLIKLGKLFEIPKLESVIPFEKTLSIQLNDMWMEDKHKIKGGKLPAKFPKIPWELWFSTHGLDWKKMDFYYRSPKWIRHLGVLLEDVPLDNWKLYLSRSYILLALPFLPSPYRELEFEFFGHVLQGQKEKKPQIDRLINVIYDYCPDIFSKLLWEEAGDEKLLKNAKAFGKSIIHAAKKRLAHVEWMKQSTRVVAIEKVGRMSMEIGRPNKWTKVPLVELEPDNFLKNVFLLGKSNMDLMFSRVGTKRTFWEEGIYRVNAYYFNEPNEIMIPYGTLLSPFYNKDESCGWNYGALGSVIGHELCHGFDENGKDYGWNGEKKKWWTRADNLAYRHKSKGLIDLFHSIKIGEKRVDGKKTLSENIADLGGVGIALEALKDCLAKSVTDYAALKAEYQKFFIAFASSWRTKYRAEKLQSALMVDKHAPAMLRVNLIVSQFDEWYDAFDISKDSDLYHPPEKRIRIF